MAANTNLASDVLHSTNHSTLSPEEIAKAVARHNHKHPAQAARSVANPGKNGKR